MNADFCVLLLALQLHKVLPVLLASSYIISSCTSSYWSY